MGVGGLVVAAASVGAQRPAAAVGTERRRSPDVHRHLRRHDPDLRRGDREAKVGDIKLQDRHSAVADAVAVALEVLRARFDAREDRDRRHPDAHLALDVHAQRRQQEGPHSRHAGRSARALPDPADAIGHQADRSLGDRRHRDAVLRSRAEEDDAHHSLAARRRARVRQHPLLARRQAAVFLRRRRADSRNRRTSPRSIRGR